MSINSSLASVGCPEAEFSKIGNFSILDLQIRNSRTGSHPVYASGVYFS